MATKIKKTGKMYLRPSAWVNQGDYTETETPGIIYHKSGWFGTTNAWEAINETTPDDDVTTLWTYFTQTSVATGDGTMRFGLCNEIPTVPYTIKSIKAHARGANLKRTGVWSGEAKVGKLALTAIGNAGRSGDETSGGLTIPTGSWGDVDFTYPTSIMSTTSYAANTIPTLDMRIVMRGQIAFIIGSSGQFYMKITQIYYEIEYEYEVTVDVNNSSYGKISSYTGGGSASTITIDAATVGTGDIYFAGWYTEYNSQAQDHYKYTNKVGSDLRYVWSESNPYPYLYAVWYDYPIQIAAGNKRVKHIYAGQREVTSVYRGNTKIYWLNAKWDEL